MTFKKILKKLLSRLLLIALLVSGTVYFLLGTETGMQLIWSGAERFLPSKLHVGRVEGALWSHIELHDIAFEDDALVIKASSVAIQWQMLPLIKRMIVVDAFQLEGVDVVIKPSQQTSKEQSEPADIAGWMNILGHIKLGKADFGTINVASGNARIKLSGKLDDAWHIEWSANIPALDELVPTLHGKFVAGGSVQGERLQPLVQTNINLTKFVSDGVSIASVSGSMHTQFKDNLKDKGVLHIAGMNVHSFHVPDVQLNTTARWQSGAFQLQAALVFSPENQIAINFTLPALIPDDGLNQKFQVSAKVAVNNLSQFNVLLRDVPQVRSLVGRINGTLTGTGRLLHPVVDAALQVQNGSIFVTDAEMKLENIMLSVRYRTGQKINLNGGFTAGGGQARLSGTYDLESPGLPLVLNLKADHVLVYNTKEYKVIISPDVKVTYQNDDLQVDGKVVIPYAKIAPVDFSSTATLPSDVVIVNDPKPDAGTPMNLTLRVQLVLGDSVKVNTHGLKATLQGSITINSAPGKPMTATGEFSLAKNGSYRAYGKQLTIKQGRLIYAGNLLTNPGISLRASQTVKMVSKSGGSQFDNTQVQPVYLGAGTATVGIDVLGTVDKPHITLFSSQPGLSQGDILSYLLFGYPQAQATEGSGLALLGVASEMVGGSSGDNKNIVSNLQQSLGLDELSVGSTEYYDQNNHVAQNTTTVNVGRSLGHNLSLHYSVGLFQSIQAFSLRYKISRHFAVQTETSTQENGGDLLYQLESRE